MARLVRILAFLGCMWPALAIGGPVVGAVVVAVAYNWGVAAFGTFIGALFAIAVAAVVANNTKPGKQQALPGFQAEAKDRQTMVRSSVEPRRVVYGRVAVSGPIIFAESTGSTNEFLHIVIPLAGHEVTGIDDVYFNDEVVALDANGFGQGRFTKFGNGTPSTHTFELFNGVTATVPGVVSSVSSVRTTDGKFTFQDVSPLHPDAADLRTGYLRQGSNFFFHSKVGILELLGQKDIIISYFTLAEVGSYIRVKKHLGTDDQAADADLVAESDGLWTTNHRLRGIAYLYVRLEFNPDVFPTGVPNIKAVVRGRKVLDPRASPSERAWSDNWALVVRDYLTSDFGLGCDDDEIDDELLIAAANVCDEMVDIESGSPAAQQRRYTANGTVNLADRPVDILRQLVSAGAGVAVFSEGVWKVFAGAYVTPEKDIDEDWLRGPIKLRAKPPRRELFNGVRGVFADPGRFWQPTDFPPVTNSTYETEDGGERILRDVELPFTTESLRAQRIAKIILEAGRQGIVAELPCNMKAFGIAAWDTVRVSIDRLGWASKVFRVIDWKFSQEGGIDLVVKEEASAVYDWVFGDATELDPAPDTALQSPFTGLDITIGTPVSGTDELFVAGDGTVVPRIRLPFTAPANPFVSYYEVQFARSGGSPQEWQDAPDVAAPATDAYFHPVEDGVAYDGRIRAVTTLGNAGAWSTFHGHAVIGKTEPPADVTGALAVQQAGGLVIVGCNEVTDRDLDTIEVRYHDEGETDWDNATPFANILRGETTVNGSLPPGTWEILLKAKDTSGNYSTNAARITIQVTAAGFTTIEQEPQAVTWFGTRTNMVLHWTGVLTPQSQSLASALGWEVFDEFVPNAYADCYYEAPLIDKGIDATARIYGDIVSVLGPGESGVTAPMLEIDYRLNSGSFDGFDHWTVGSANFRYLKARIHVDTTIGKPVISQFTPSIDAEARTETGTLTVDGTGTGVVTFDTPFHTTPVLAVSPQGSGNVSASWDSLTTSGFTGYFKSGGASAAGTLSYNATGA